MADPLGSTNDGGLQSKSYPSKRDGHYSGNNKSSPVLRLGPRYIGSRLCQVGTFFPSCKRQTYCSFHHDILRRLRTASEAYVPDTRVGPRVGRRAAPRAARGRRRIGPRQPRCGSTVGKTTTMAWSRSSPPSPCRRRLRFRGGWKRGLEPGTGNGEGGRLQGSGRWREVS